MFTAGMRAQSEIKGAFSLKTVYDSNPLNLNEEKNSAASISSLQLMYKPLYSSFNAQYSGSNISLLNFPERNYHFHQAGFNFSLQPFNYQYFEIFAGANSTIRKNSTSSAVYDNLNINTKFGGVLYSDYGVIEISYTPAFTRFCNNTYLTNFTNNIEISLDKSFDFETKIKASAVFSTRNYYNSINSNNDNISHENGKNYLRYQINEADIMFPNSVFEKNVSNIISAFIELNHPLSLDISIWLRLNKNFHLNKNALYFSPGNEDSYYIFNLSDDNFNFEESKLSLFADFKIIPQMMLSLDFQYFQRDYLYDLSLINPFYPNDKNRSDEGMKLMLNMNFLVLEYESFIDKFILGLRGDYWNNNSNLNEYTFSSGKIMLNAKMLF